MKKIHEVEFEAFKLNMDTLDTKDIIDSLSYFDSNIIIDDIINQFTTTTIHYKTGGSYHCNESNYDEYHANLYFGFVKIA